MFSLEILLLGVALAIDAAVVTFAVGLIHGEMDVTSKIKRGIVICMTFGVFQAFMLWLGSYAGYLFSYSNYGFYFRLIVGIIFIGLAIKFIQESLSLEKKHVEWKIVPVVILAFATSIDAMAAGVSLGTLPKTYYAAVEVGLITFLICGFFYFMSQFFIRIPDRWLLRISALIFVVMGGEIFWSYRHLFFRG